MHTFDAIAKWANMQQTDIESIEWNWVKLRNSPSPDTRIVHFQIALQPSHFEPKKKQQKPHKIGAINKQEKSPPPTLDLLYDLFKSCSTQHFRYLTSYTHIYQN